MSSEQAALVLWDQEFDGSACFSGLIADTPVVSNLPLPGMTACAPQAMPNPNHADWVSATRTQGWLAGALRDIEIQRNGAGAERFQLSDLGTIEIGSGVGVFRPQVSLDVAARCEVLLGPVLIPLLARRGRFVLHASAVTRDGAAVLFAGDSGQGKSTLARGLDEAGWRRIADDLCVAMKRQDWVCLTRVPQLKLADPVDLDLSPEYPLAAVFLPERGGSRLQIERLEPAVARLAMLRHGVSARLFAKSILQAHLHHVTALTRDVPVYRMVLPNVAVLDLHLLVEQVRNEIGVLQW